MNLFSSRLQTKAIQISSTQNIQIAIGCVLADITDAYEILLLHVLSELRMNNFSNFLSLNLRFHVSSCVKMVIGKAIECPIKCWVLLRKSSNLNIILWLVPWLQKYITVLFWWCEMFYDITIFGRNAIKVSITSVS